MTDEMTPVICPCHEDKSQHEPEPTALYVFASASGRVALVCSQCGQTFRLLDQAA